MLFIRFKYGFQKFEDTYFLKFNKSTIQNVWNPASWTIILWKIYSTKLRFLFFELLKVSQCLKLWTFKCSKMFECLNYRTFNMLKRFGTLNIDKLNYCHFKHVWIFDLLKCSNKNITSIIARSNLVILYEFNDSKMRKFKTPLYIPVAAAAAAPFPPPWLLTPQLLPAPALPQPCCCRRCLPLHPLPPALRLGIVSLRANQVFILGQGVPLTVGRSVGR